MFCIRMDDPPERYYPGLDLVYDREHRARLIERGDMDLAEKVNNVLHFFVVAITKIVSTEHIMFVSFAAYRSYAHEGP